MVYIFDSRKIFFKIWNLAYEGLWLLISLPFAFLLYFSFLEDFKPIYFLIALVMCYILLRFTMKIIFSSLLSFMKWSQDYKDRQDKKAKIK